MGNGEHGRRKTRVQVTLGPHGIVGLPLRTLSDAYSDTPEPEDSDRVPAPDPPSLARRLVDRLIIALRGRTAGEE
jgi:hypothetical protein